MVEVDVLIVGGGAQGLWLLHDLNKRDYRAVLLERGELGGGQTCHSHGLIHRGHYYDDKDMMITLNAAAQFWEAFVGERGITKLNTKPALAGFGPGADYRRYTSFWDAAGLKYDRSRNKPDVLTGGKVKNLFRTEEFSLDPSEVIETLARDLDHATYRLQDRGDALTFTHDGKSVTRAEAALIDEHVEFTPKFVVFAAGVGNHGLLAKLGAEHNKMAGGSPVQAQRKNHMMVLRGADLPLMTAVFPIHGGLTGVFLCSRTDPSTGQCVWLVSDHNSMPFDIAAGGTSQAGSAPSEEWVKRILISLRSTAPGLFANGTISGLDVALYTGLTSERNFGAGQHMTDLYIDAFGFENILAIWPTKLTLTPFASNVAERFIRPKVPEPAGKWPVIQREITGPPPTVAPEMWRRKELSTAHECKTDWLPYPDFANRWHL